MIRDTSYEGITYPKSKGGDSKDRAKRGRWQKAGYDPFMRLRYDSNVLMEGNIEDGNYDYPDTLTVEQAMELSDGSRAMSDYGRAIPYVYSNDKDEIERVYQQVAIEHHEWESEKDKIESIYQTVARAHHEWESRPDFKDLRPMSERHVRLTPFALTRDD